MGNRSTKGPEKGNTIKVDPRKVIINEFELTRIELPEIDFRVHCSKGTYIRSLVHDFGKALNSGAYMTELCRTKIGDFKLSEAWNLEELVTYLEQQTEEKTQKEESKSEES